MKKLFGIGMGCLLFTLGLSVAHADKPVKVLVDTSRECKYSEPIRIQGEYFGILLPTIDTATVDFEVSPAGKVEQSGCKIYDKTIATAQWTFGDVEFTTATAGTGQTVLEDKVTTYNLTNSTYAANIRATGCGGTGATLTAADSHYLYVTSAALTSMGTSDFTFLASFKHDTISTSDDGLVRVTSTSAMYGWCASMESDGTLTFSVSDDDSTVDVATTTAGYDDNAWHRLALVKDGISTIYIYVDGLEATSLTLSYATQTITGGQAFEIGRASDTYGTGTLRYWDGSIDDVVWAKGTALTAAQVYDDWMVFNAAKNAVTVSGAQITSGTGAVYVDKSSYLQGYTGYVRIKFGTGQTSDKELYIYQK